MCVLHDDDDDAVGSNAPGGLFEFGVVFFTFGGTRFFLAFFSSSFLHHAFFHVDFLYSPSPTYAVDSIRFFCCCCYFFSFDPLLPPWGGFALFFLACFLRPFTSWWLVPPLLDASVWVCSFFPFFGGVCLAWGVCFALYLSICVLPFTSLHSFVHRDSFDKRCFFEPLTMCFPSA